MPIGPNGQGSIAVIPARDFLDAFWDTHYADSPTVIPNIGTDQTIPEAVLNGDMFVATGPGFYVPDLPDHAILVFGFTITPVNQFVSLPYTDGALTILPSDPEVGDSLFTASTGQQVAVADGAPPITYGSTFIEYEGGTVTYGG